MDTFAEPRDVRVSSHEASTLISWTRRISGGAQRRPLHSEGRRRP